MATINSHEASPWTTSRWSYHVFVSFRGEDTRRAFTAHLYNALFLVGLRTFRDDYELERRERILSRLQKAIEGSRVSIIVLSKNYASSRWRLEELVMILKRRSSGHLVIPVFYDVDPSEVGEQIGGFKEAFMRHERRIEMEMGEQKNYLKGKVQEWRMALKEVANLAGFQFSPNIFEADESHFIQRVSVKVTEIVTTNNRAHPGRQDRRDFCASHLEDERTRGKRSRDEISSHVFSLDILQQHFGNKREDVAKSLGISVSTLKRNCRYHGIPRWPNRIRNNAVYSEIEAARGSSKRVFHLEGQTTQSTNREGISSHVFSLDILQPHFGSKRKDVAKSLGISESTLKRICRYHGIPRWPNRIRSSVSGLPNPYGVKNPLPTFNTLSTNGQITMENEVGGQNLEPNECLPAVYSETEAAGGSSEWVFQLEGQTTQYFAYSNSNAPVFPQPHIASEEVLNENGGSSEDRRDSLASQAEASFEGHVSESSNLMVLACSDAAAPNQPLATMPTVPDIIPHLTGGSSEFSGCPNLSGIVDPHPQIASTQILSENMITPEDLSVFLVSQEEPFMEEYGSGSINQTIPSCLDPAPSQQPMMPPISLVDPHPQIASTQILSDNMGTLEDLSIFLVSQEPFMKESGSGNNQTIPSCLDPAPSQQPMMPPLIASQDTSSVRVKATNGHTIIAFKLSFASGITQLKEEVSKRPGFELGNFNLKYMDADGDLVSIACDDDVRDYLQLLTGNQVSKLFVS